MSGNAASLNGAFETHLQEITALLDAGLRVARDPEIPPGEKTVEILRVIDKVRMHAVKAEYAALVMGGAES